MNDTHRNLIYLLACAVNGIIPDKEIVNTMDLVRLYRLAEFHSTRAAICIALNRAGINNEDFYQAYKKAVRKNIMLDMERTEILNCFERQGIWYMPLKGAIIKELYPENGMREMADNDILYDSTKQEKVKEIMLEKGYTAESIGRSHHDTYMKPPVLNFELHTVLFGITHTESLYRYYSDIKRLLCKDDENNYGYHFSDEDFYVYITAHEYKHYSGNGTGVRNLLDCYIYIKNKGDVLDWKYIEEQCDNLGMKSFEKDRRGLAMKLFSSVMLPVLNDTEKELLMCYMTAGTYGTFENGIKNQLQTHSKLSFLIRSIFISRQQMAQSVPFTTKSFLLYPLGVIWRCIRISVLKRDRLKQTIKGLKKYGK